MIPTLVNQIPRAFAQLAAVAIFAAPAVFAQDTCQPYDRCAISCSPSTLSDIRRSKYRGWDHLIAKLRQDGIDEGQIKAFYQDPRMPPFGEIPYRIKPIETAQMYSQFASKIRLAAAKKFLGEYSHTLSQAQKRYGVSKSIIVAILLIETHFGQNMGQELVLNRLSRVASVTQPCNMIVNFRRLRKDDRSVRFSDVVLRARYLESIFYPEIPALFDMARQYNIDILNLRGSISGAFGMPQFLPTTFLRFGADGNGDKKIDLANPQDAINSTANFLASLGYHDTAGIEQKRQAIWRYNHSDAYVDAVLHVARAVATQ